MLESYDIKEDTESIPMGKILALFVRATHLQSRGLLQMKVQEGFLQVFHCQSDSFFYRLIQNTTAHFPQIVHYAQELFKNLGFIFFDRIM